MWRKWVLSRACPSAHTVTGQMLPESPRVLGPEPHAGLEPGARLAFLGREAGSHQASAARGCDPVAAKARAVEAEGLLSAAGTMRLAIKGPGERRLDESTGAERGEISAERLSAHVSFCSSQPLRAAAWPGLGSCPLLAP